MFWIVGIFTSANLGFNNRMMRSIINFDKLRGCLRDLDQAVYKVEHPFEEHDIERPTLVAPPPSPIGRSMPLSPQLPILFNLNRVITSFKALKKAIHNMKDDDMEDGDMDMENGDMEMENYETPGSTPRSDMRSIDLSPLSTSSGPTTPSTTRSMACSSDRFWLNSEDKDEDNHDNDALQKVSFAFLVEIAEEVVNPLHMTHEDQIWFVRATGIILPKLFGEATVGPKMMKILQMREVIMDDGDFWGAIVCANRYLPKQTSSGAIGWSREYDGDHGKPHKRAVAKFKKGHHFSKNTVPSKKLLTTATMEILDNKRKAKNQTKERTTNRRMANNIKDFCDTF